MKDKLSLEIVTKKPSPDEKPDFVLNYLATEKAAAKLRRSNYCKTNKEESEDSEEDESKVHKTEVRSDNHQLPKQQRVISTPRGRGDQFRSRGGSRGRGRGAPTQRRGEVDGGCLMCGEDHTTSRCSNWMNLENSKYELIGMAIHGLDKPLCTWCLEPGHRHYECTSEAEVGCPCGSNWNAILCVKTPECVSRENWNNTKGNSATVCSNFTKVNNVKIGHTLNPIVKVKVSQSNVILNSLFDNCSQSTFILNSVAKKLKLKGSMVNYVLICTDGSRTQKNGFIYNMQIKDIYGNTHHIVPHAVDHIHYMRTPSAPPRILV